MKTIALLALSIVTLAATPVAAVDFTIGTGTSGNCFPFGCQLTGQPSTLYQQVCDAAAFLGMVTITALSFTVTSGGTQLSTARSPSRFRPPMSGPPASIR